MEFGIKDVVYLMGIAAAVAGSFFGTRHKLKEYFRDISSHNRTSSDFHSNIYFLLKTRIWSIIMTQ